MKRLALVLSSLLATAAIAQATTVETSKEVMPVVPAPVMEKPAFRPSGYLSLEYRAYGKTENQNDSRNIVDPWHEGENEYSRLQTMFGVQATEKFRIDGRIRDYNNLQRNDNTRVNKVEGTDTRLRFSYKHNDLFTSRLEYRDYTSNTQKFEYQARLKVYQNDGAILSGLTVAPKLAYFYDNDGINGDTVLGANIEYEGNLPLGFTWDGTLYLDQHFYNHDRNNYSAKLRTPGMKDYKSFDKELTVSWEIYLYRTFALYADDKTTVDFQFEGGYDPYKFRHYTRYDKNTYKKLGKNTYSLYTSLYVDASYKLTEAVTLNGGVGAEYRNWAHEWQDSAKDWRWQPFAYAGMKVTF